MKLAGTSVPNNETVSMASMIRENRPLCGDIAALLTIHSREEVARRLRKRTTEALRNWYEQLAPFTRAAVLTALRRTVDWEAVISLVLVDPETN